MSESNGLPVGWTLSPISSAVLPQTTRNPRKEQNGKFHYVDIDALDNSKQKIVSPKLLDKADAPSRARMEIRKGDVIFSLVRPYLKNLAIVPDELDRQIASTAYCVLRPKPDIDSRFLFYQLLQDSFIHSIPTYGNSPPSARDEEFLAMEIRVAPEREQINIVNKIDELFSDLDAGVAALENAKAKLKRYRSAVLKAGVEGKLTEEWRAKNPDVEPAPKLLERILIERRKKWEADQLAKFAAAGKQPPKNWKGKYVEPRSPDASELTELPRGWCWATLGQLNSGDRPMSYGVLQPGPGTPDGVPLVRVCDIGEGVVFVNGLKRIQPNISRKYQRTILQGGELLLTIVGTIGRAALAPLSIKGANTARAVAVISLTTLIDSRFVELSLRETGMRTRMTLAAHEVARKTLNLEDVREATIPLPPLAEQLQIAEGVEERLSVNADAERLVCLNLRRAAQLRNSILRDAFVGNLVATASNAFMNTRSRIHTKPPQKQRIET